MITFFRGTPATEVKHGLSLHMVSAEQQVETAAGNLWSLAPAVLLCRHWSLVTAATLIQPQTTGNK